MAPQGFKSHHDYPLERQLEVAEATTREAVERTCANAPRLRGPVIGSFGEKTVQQLLPALRKWPPSSRRMAPHLAVLSGSSIDNPV